MTNYSDIYNPDEGFDAYLSNITAKKVENNYLIKNSEILDIGAGTGIISEYFYKDNNISIFEKHSKYVDVLRKKFEPNKIFIQDFMSSDISCLFDYIFIFNNIQEQENIELFLLKASKNLSPNGSILLTYPNALSIHRIIAKGLGVIKDINSEKSDNSKKYGDFHLLTNEKIRDVVSAVNLKIKLEDGIFFKPFTSAVLEKLNEKELDFLTSFTHLSKKLCFKLCRNYKIMRILTDNICGLTTAIYSKNKNINLCIGENSLFNGFKK